MAVIQIETGSCFGRGFVADSATGFLKLFRDWIVKVPASGGPEWYIIDDSSTDGTDPFIIVSDVASPTVNGYNNGKGGEAQKIIKFQALDSTSGQVDIYTYAGWSGSAPYGPMNIHYALPTVDAGTYAYDFRGGDEFLAISSQISGVYQTFFIGDFTADTDFLGSASEVGTLASGMTGGTDTEVITLGAGETANFTVGGIYFIYDWTAHDWLQCVECTNINAGANEITIYNTGFIHGNLEAYPSGAVIGARPHRWVSFCQASNLVSWTSTFSLGYVPMIEHNRSSSVYWPIDHGDNYTNVNGKVIALGDIYDRNDPNFSGVRIVQEAYIKVAYSCYRYDYASYEKYLGKIKNIYMGGDSGLAPGLDGLTINAQEWIYMAGDTFLPNFTSLS